MDLQFWGPGLSSWPSELPWVLLGLRSVHLGASGVSSAELVYGAPASLPGFRCTSFLTSSMSCGLIHSAASDSRCLRHHSTPQAVVGFQPCQACLSTTLWSPSSSEASGLASCSSPSTWSPEEGSTAFSSFYLPSSWSVC